MSFALPTYSQEHNTVTNTLLAESFAAIPYNSIGIGVNAVISDMSIYNRPRLMYSLLYRYQVSPILSIESNIHFLSAMEFSTDRRANGRNSFSFPVGTPIPWRFSQETISLHSLSGDVDVVCSPFFDIRGWSGLRGGLGVSVRSAGMLKSKQEFSSDKPTEYTFRLEHTLQTAIGGNARIEYIFPLDKTVDMGFRLYGQVFLPPVGVVGDPVPIGMYYDYINPAPKEGIQRIAIGAVGIGMFLYLNF